MTRWVTEVSCEFPEIKQGACGSSEEWTWMSKVPDGALSKKMLSMIDGAKLQTQTSYVIWGDPPWIQMMAAWRHLWVLQYKSLKQMEEEGLCANSRLKEGDFRFEKENYLRENLLIIWTAGVRVIPDSFAVNEWAKAEAVANLKVNRWGGEQSVRWSKSLGDCKERRENMRSLQMKGRIFSVGTSYQSCGNLYL